MATLTGHCHCGNVHTQFETELPLEQLPLRACQCAFCRSHGAVTTTDHLGKVTITAIDSKEVQHYRFGLGIADFLICRCCGDYVAALMEADGKRYASINVNILDCRPWLTTAPTPMNYGGESAAERITRRMAGWTPVESGPGTL